MWTGQGLGHEDGREGDGGSGSSGSMTPGGSPGEEQGGSGTQASWGGVSPWLVLTLSLAWAMAVGVGRTGPSYREMEQVAPGTGSCPLCCVGPWEHSAWQAGRQAAASEPCLLSSLLSETPDTPLQTLAHHSLHRPPPGMEKSPAPEGLGSTGRDKTHLRTPPSCCQPCAGL